MGWNLPQSLLVCHQLKIEGILLRENINRTSIGKTDVDYRRKGWHAVLIIVIVHKKEQVWIKKV